MLRELEARTEFPGLAGLISLDSSIAIELLVAANSPACGFTSRVYTVDEAVVVLGWEHTKRLIRAVVK